MVKARTESIDLKESCVRAAREVIAERGIDALSLRDVARRLGVSHQAPYKHYPSRDHLLAEVMRRCFADFARALDSRPAAHSTRDDLAQLGRTYLSYASTHPLEYQLMFATPWPTPAEHPALARDAAHAFDVLRRVLQRLYPEHTPAAEIDATALFIWSCMHGLAGIQQGNVLEQLDLDASVSGHASDHILQRISRALGVNPPGAE